MRRNGSQDIPLQNHDFEQDGRRHFIGFQPNFHLNMTSQTLSCKAMKKMKEKYLRSLLFETLQAIRALQRNFASFEISLLWQPKSKRLSIIEKTKGLLFEQKCFSKNNLKQHSLIVNACGIIF